MATPKEKAGAKKRLETLAEDTEKQKKALVAQLRRTPIVQLACERVGIGRSTYYKWRVYDHIFARAAEKAQEAGKFFINDLAESRLLRMVQDDNLTAIIFWLKHNNPKYAVTTRFIHEYEVATERMSVEELNAYSYEIAKIRARKIKLPETTEEMKERIEEELEDAERKAPDRKRMEEFGEDPEEK